MTPVEGYVVYVLVFSGVVIFFRAIVRAIDESDPGDR